MADSGIDEPVEVERMVRVGDLELCTAEAGGGGRPLLLVHGWTGAKEDFGDWMAPLAAAGYHAVAPDLRGHGSSDKPAQEDAYTFDQYVDDLLGLVEVLGWERFALVGHSMGGMIAQVLALRKPSLLDALVLMDTHHGPLATDADLLAAGIDAARTVGTAGIADLMAVATEPGPLETEAYRRVCAERPGYFERGIDNTRRSSSAMFAASLIEVSTCRSRLDLLCDLSLPTLVVVGEQDSVFLDPSHRLAQVIPGASLAVIADAGHSPQVEAPQAWWDAVGAFLAETCPPRKAMSGS